MALPARKLGHVASTVENLVEANRRSVDAIVARGEGKELEELLVEAEADLRKQLTKALGRNLGDRWTGQSIASSRAAVRDVLRHVRASMMGQLGNQANELAAKAMKDTLRILKAGEAAFSGTTPLLSLDTAMRFSNVHNGVQSSLLRQYPTSVDRYTTRMIGEFERQMQLGVLTGQTHGQMIDRLVGHRGPKGVVSIRARVLPDGTVQRTATEDVGDEGLFRKHRYWAERIVRTELLNAYNQGTQQTIAEEQQADFPDLKRIILAHFDRRTAPDSVYVHGQIKGPNEYFVDGAGREYLTPPGRPNDRERLAPWRESWGKPTGTLAPKPEGEREKAAAEASAASETRGTRRAADASVTERPKAKRHPTPPPPPPTPPRSTYWPEPPKPGDHLPPWHMDAQYRPPGRDFEANASEPRFRHEHERRIANQLRTEGNDVYPIRRSNTEKRGDASVNAAIGHPDNVVEFKSIRSQIPGYKKIVDRALEAARKNVPHAIVDVRGSVLTIHDARLAWHDERLPGRLRYLRVIGDGFDLTLPLGGP